MRNRTLVREFWRGRCSKSKEIIAEWSTQKPSEREVSDRLQSSNRFWKRNVEKIILSQVSVYHLSPLIEISEWRSNGRFMFAGGRLDEPAKVDVFLSNNKVDWIARLEKICVELTSYHKTKKAALSFSEETLKDWGFKIKKVPKKSKKK